MSSLVMFVQNPKALGIVRMDFCSHCILHRPWSSVSMEFITDLPPSKSFDCIFVVVNRLTKITHFVPCKKTSSSEDTARLFLDNVYRYHGLPDDIVSDCGTEFVSKFWRSLFEMLKVDMKLSSAFHPQTDGQTKRVNQVFGAVFTAQHQLSTGRLDRISTASRVSL